MKVVWTLERILVSATVVLHSGTKFRKKVVIIQGKYVDKVAIKIYLGKKSRKMNTHCTQKKVDFLRAWKKLYF